MTEIEIKLGTEFGHAVYSVDNKLMIKIFAKYNNIYRQMCFDYQEQYDYTELIESVNDLLLDSIVDKVNKDLQK